MHKCGTIKLASFENKHRSHVSITSHTVGSIALLIYKYDDENKILPNLEICYGVDVCCTNSVNCFKACNRKPLEDVVNSTDYSWFLVGGGWLFYASEHEIFSCLVVVSITNFHSHMINIILFSIWHWFGICLVFWALVTRNLLFSLHSFLFIFSLASDWFLFLRHLQSINVYFSSKMILHKFKRYRKEQPKWSWRLGTSPMRKVIRFGTCCLGKKGTA